MLTYADRWVLEKALTREVLALWEQALPHLGSWEYAPLSVVLIETAGRGLCFLRRPALVVPSWTSRPLPTPEQRKALGMLFSSASPRRSAPSTWYFSRLCDAEWRSRRAEAAAAAAPGVEGRGGGGGGVGGSWEVVAGGCEGKKIYFVRPAAGEHFGSGRVSVVVVAQGFLFPEDVRGVVVEIAGQVRICTHTHTHTHTHICI